MMNLHRMRIAALVAVTMRDLFIEGLKIEQHLETNPEGGAQIEVGWLFYPEFRTLGARAQSIERSQKNLLLELLEHSEADDLSRRILPDVEMVEESIRIKLECPKDMPLWGQPLELEFAYLVWEQSKLLIAYVPSLGVEITIGAKKDKVEVLEDQIRFALTRRRINRRLFDLSLLQRCQTLEIKRVKMNVYPLTPKDRAMREDGEEQPVELVLKEVGRRMDRADVDPVYERDRELEQMVSYLGSKRGVSSLLLVGESGIGKSAMIHYLAANQRKLGLVKEREFFYTPGSRIVAGMSGFGEWQERCRKIALEASAKKGKLLYFGNLLEMLEVGQNASTSESVGAFFRPWLIRGQVIAIAECTPDQLAEIEQKDPRMLEAFRLVRIEPSNRASANKVLRQFTDDRASRVVLSSAALKRIFSLHNRYSGYSAMPGKMLHFTRRLIDHHAPTADRKQKATPVRITPSAINQMFALETGLPLFLLDENARLDIEEVTAWFKQRIKGQPGAVSHVIDTIATIKARLSRPNRPLGTFLFVGPTGVGKTELAKTLAEYFYGSPDRLLRIDMSEYSAPGSAMRLASGGAGEPEGILTSKMRDQPFSVVLLDEFEKADSSVYDLFLQVLGEARLTDAAGRVADFSNAMIILTSNLGAAEFRAVAPGFGDPEVGIDSLAMDHFVAAAKKRFRPEFFNRIARIVPFLPLDQQSVREVIEREMSKLDSRDGFKTRDLSLVIADEVVDSLAEGGFDPRYGARPIKRSISERMLTSLGNYLVEHPHLESGSIKVSRFGADGGLDFAYCAEDESRDETERSKLRTWNERIPNLRRWYQILSNSHLISELHSEVRRLERKVKQKGKPIDHEALAHCQGMLERLLDQSAQVYQLEETLLITCFENSSFQPLQAAVQAAPQWASFCDLLQQVYEWIQKSTPRIVLVFVADQPALLSRFAGAYREVAKGFGCRIKVGYYRNEPKAEDLHPDQKNERKPYLPSTDVEIESLFSGEVPAYCCAIALELSKSQIGLRFNLELGIHQFINPDASRTHVRVLTYDYEEVEMETNFIDDATLLNQDFAVAKLRRIWDQREAAMRDAVWGSSIESEKVDPRELPPEFSVDGVSVLIEMTLLDKALEAIRS